MNIFLSGSIRGGRQLLDTYVFMMDAINSTGACVVSPHVARSTVFDEEKALSEADIFFRDMGGIQQCDHLIAEVTVPSTGMGYEICYALGLGKPVLCVYQHGAKVSSMVLGNPDIAARSYRDNEELKTIIIEFIRTC